MALTTRTSTVVTGWKVQFVSMPLTAGQPSQADLDSFAALTLAGWQIAGFSAVDASSCLYTLTQLIS